MAFIFLVWHGVVLGFLNDFLKKFIIISSVMMDFCRLTIGLQCGWMCGNIKGNNKGKRT